MANLRFIDFPPFKLVKYNYMLYMNSPFSYKGKFIEGYTAITVLLPDMISKRLSRLIVASYYHLQGKRSSSFIFQIFEFPPHKHVKCKQSVNKCLYPVYKSPKNVVYSEGNFFRQYGSADYPDRGPAKNCHAGFPFLNL